MPIRPLSISPRLLRIGLIASLSLPLAAFTACERTPPAATASDPAKALPVALVKEEKAASVIILGDAVDSDLHQIALDFVETVRQATSAEIPILAESGAATGLPAEVARIYLGPCAEAAALGITPEGLPEEGYRIVTRGNALYIVGRDEARPEDELQIVSKPTRWALNHLLERQLGVRWLWPGKLGTYVPKARELVIPAMDLTAQPRLEQRRIRISVKSTSPILSGDAETDLRLRREAATWAENHQQGQRSRVVFGHAFGHWWERYSAQHPDYFALPPEGVTQPLWNKPGWIKLRLSNPAVIEQIAREYEEAGKPEYYNVCPNDGAGFDLSPETLAWDIPQGQKKDDIWKARANLTGRYVKFWNLLYERLREINPDVKLSTYAYHSYKTPPTAERPLTAKAVLGIVPGYKDYALWEGWSRQEGTVGMVLRPNWGHIGANAPYLPVEETASYMRFAWGERMQGFDLDSLVGFWSTQGLIYYTWARMMTHPEMTADQLIDEYTSAFGQGAPQIRAYFAYWQRLTKEYAYADTYASDDEEAKKGRYMQLLKEGKTQDSFVLGPRLVLPYLYGDDVLQPAYALLDEAKAAIGGGDAEAAARVDFLRDGLRELALTRDAIAMSREINKASPEADRIAFAKLSAELEALREELAPRHVIWSQRVTGYEDRRRVPMRPRTMGLPQLPLEGL